MNKPYVKQLNNFGEILNPIVGTYLSPFQTRMERRNKPKRFKGNNKGVNLTVTKMHKFKRIVQRFWVMVEGKHRTIYHYQAN